MVDFIISWEMRSISNDTCYSQGEHFVHQVRFVIPHSNGLGKLIGINCHLEPNHIQLQQQLLSTINLAWCNPSPQVPFFSSTTTCPLKFQIHPPCRVVQSNKNDLFPLCRVEQLPQGLLLRDIQITLQNISPTDSLSVTLEADTEASARNLSIQHFQTGMKVIRDAQEFYMSEARCLFLSHYDITFSASGFRPVSSSSPMAALH